MVNKLTRLIFLTGVFSLLIAYPSWAEQPASSLKQQIQITPSSQLQITEVRLNSTNQELEIILEADGSEQLQPASRVEGNSFIADIPNPQLRLLSGDEFRAQNPTNDIAEVTVINVTPNTVRVTVTGAITPPKVALFDSDEGLIFGVALTPTTPSQAQDDLIELLVVGEQGGYTFTETPTTTRLDIPLRDNPRSLQVIPQQVIEDQAVQRVGDALRNVSGVVQDGGFGGTADQFNIRGFFGATVLRNGLRDTGNIQETANIERLEILKGPASILFGNIEPGGVVNLVTKQPLSEPYTAIEAQIGSYGLFRPTIDLSGSLRSDRLLRYRLNIAYEGFDGFRDFDQNVERFFISPVVAWDISENTSLSVELSYLNDQRPFDRGFVAIGRNVADIPIERFLGEPDDFRESEEIAVGYQIEHQFSDDWRIRNRFRVSSTDERDYRAEPVELDETTGILTRNFRSNDDVGESYTLQTEVAGNFATGSLNHNVLVGVDLTRQTFAGTQSRFPVGLTPSINIFDPDYNQIPRPDLSDLTNLVRNGSDRTDALGIFVQDLIEITDNFKVLLAGRLDFVEQESRDRLSQTTSGQAADTFSPVVGVIYQPIAPLPIYANVARSFQPNFGTRVDGSFLEPERGTQYEIGLRGEFFERRLIANLAAYNITKSNVATTDPANPDFSIPLGEQRSRGIELDVIGEISPGWNLVASYGYIDASITESNDFPVGSRIQNVPEHTASLWTTYEIQTGDLQGLGFGLGLFYVGERAGDSDDSFDLPSYLRTDAAIFYRQNNWRAAINIQNLFDVTYFRANNFGRVAIEPGAPLTVVGSLAVEF